MTLKRIRSGTDSGDGYFPLRERFASGTYRPVFESTGIFLLVQSPLVTVSVRC